MKYTHLKCLKMHLNCTPSLEESLAGSHKTLRQKPHVGQQILSFPNNKAPLDTFFPVHNILDCRDVQKDIVIKFDENKF